MRFISLFSGAGGFDLGLEAAGWECVAQVEWNKECQQVLNYRWPEVPKWSDISTVNGADLPAADAVVFGSPCQDLSVAGRRAGLGGSRSGLFFEAIRVIREMQNVGNPPAWVVWENVVGALSSNQGDDFKAVIDTFAEIGALDIAWRVLDARFFGVPQRRRRVFVVADFAGHRAGQVLFESEGVRWNPHPSLAPWAAAAARIGSGTEGSDCCVDTTVSWVGSAQEVNVAEQLLADYSQQLTTSGGNPGQEYPVVFEQRSLMDENWTSKEVHSALRAEASSVGAVVLAFSAGNSGNSYDIGLTEDCTPPLRAGSSGTNQVPTIAFSHTQGLDCQPSSEHWPTLRREGAGHAVATSAIVRRLTPLECERLMGWPDNHTAYRAEGIAMPDSHRYKMCGNGVVGTVSQWLGEQMMKAQ